MTDPGTLLRRLREWLWRILSPAGHGALSAEYLSAFQSHIAPVLGKYRSKAWYSHYSAESTLSKSVVYQAPDAGIIPKIILVQGADPIHMSHLISRSHQLESHMRALLDGNIVVIREHGCRSVMLPFEVSRHGLGIISNALPRSSSYSQIWKRRSPPDPLQQKSHAD